MATRREYTPEQLHQEWRKRHEGSRRASKKTRWRIFIMIVVGILSSVTAIVGKLLDTDSAATADQTPLQRAMSSYELVASIIGLALIVLVTYRVSKYVRLRRNLDADSERFHPLSEEATEELDRVLLPLCTSMWVERTRIKPIVPNVSKSFSPSIVEKKDRGIILVVPPDFLTLLVVAPKAAEAMLAHELGHVVQEDTNLWLYASAFGDTMVKYYMPVYVIQALIIFVVATIWIRTSGWEPTMVGLIIAVLIPIFSLLLFLRQIRKYRRVSEELADLAAWLFTLPHGEGLKSAFSLFNTQRRRQQKAPPTAADAVAPFGFLGEALTRRPFFSVHPDVPHRVQKADHFTKVTEGTERRLRLSSYGAYDLGVAVPVGVVMAALLAAVLFPVFAQARESARKASCMSNEKQIALGIMMYVQDYDERFPGSLDRAGNEPDPAKGDPNLVTWSAALNPYTKNPATFICPNVLRNKSTRTGSSPDPNKNIDTSYLYNGIYALKKLADIDEPAQTCLIHESQKIGPALQDPHLVPIDDPTHRGPRFDPAHAVGFNSSNFDNLHSVGANLALSDGHAKYYLKKDIRYSFFGAPDSKNVGQPQNFETGNDVANKAFNQPRNIDVSSAGALDSDSIGH